MSLPSSADMALLSTEIIRQLLPVERDAKIVAPFQFCLIGKIGHQFFPGGLTGGIFDLLIQIHIFLRYDS